MLMNSTANTPEIDANTLNLFSRTTAIYLIITLSAIMLAYILMNSFWKWFRKDNYKGVRFTTKNIAYITMLSSVSVVATIIVSVAIPIAVLPPIRIAFEGLMIKITGYMFGPIIGIICAAVTDILVMLFVPSYISVYYMFCIIFTGFLAGIAGIVKVRLKDHPWVIFSLINFFIIFFAAGGAYLVISRPGETIKISGGINANKIAVAVMMIIVGLLALLSIYIMLIHYMRKKQMERVKEILPIILLAVVAEYLTTVLIASYADIMLFDPSNNDYSITAIVRILQAPIKIIVNSIVIYITWKTVSPLINIDNNNY